MFAIKFNPNESIAKLEACLLAKDCAQTYGIHNSDIFSPIGKMTYVQLFIFLVAYPD